MFACCYYNSNTRKKKYTKRIKTNIEIELNNIVLDRNILNNKTENSLKILTNRNISKNKQNILNKIYS